MLREWYRFGELRKDENITPDIIKKVLEDGKVRLKEFKKVPLLKILRILHETGQLLIDPDKAFKKEILATIPDLIGFSPEMVTAGIETLSDTLEMTSLLKRLNIDLGNGDYLDNFLYHDEFRGYIKAEPRGIVAHISAGNVFIGAIDTLVQGIITKNINILKMSGNDPVFPILFTKALKEADPEGVVANTFCLIPYRSEEKEIEKIIKSESNAIVVYGGEEAVRAYREDAGLHTKIIEYGPKYSCALIDGKRLIEEGIDKVTKLLARDFTMWDQSACSSPHTVFVKGEEEALSLAHSLSKSLEEYSKIYPHGRINIDEQVEITKHREIARVWQALGEGELIIPAVDKQDWTVIYEKSPSFKVSCHHRTAYVKPVNELTEAVEILKPYGEFIQSISILAEEKAFFSLSNSLTSFGSDRITEVGNMAKRKHGTPHDGTRGTAEFVRWVSIGKSARFIDSFDYMEDSLRDNFTIEKLNYLLSYSRKYSSFYKDRLPEKPLKSLSDLAKIPVMSQELFKSHLPPSGKGILTGPLVGTYSFGSGGTIGNPKFIYRTIEETHRNARSIGKGLYLSTIEEGDIVANLFFAGNMWASFVSVNMALEYTGCHILPIASNACDMEGIISYIKAFNANTVISIPSVIISLAQYVEKNNIKDINIKKVLYGGEHLFPDAKKYIGKILGTEKFSSAGYATNDSGSIAYQCKYCNDGIHHIDETLHIVEILEPETNKVLPWGETGKIVVTNIDRLLMPVIRYDIGDMGRILKEKCPCGRTVRLLDLLGRSDDVLIIGGGNISVDAVAKAIGKVEGLSFHFRMTGSLVDMHDLLSIEVETVKSVSDEETKTLEEKLYRSLISEKPEFEAFMKTGSIAKPVIRILHPETIPRNPRTGKVKHVLDERMMKD